MGTCTVCLTPDTLPHEVRRRTPRSREGLETPTAGRSRCSDRPPPG